MPKSLAEALEEEGKWFDKMNAPDSSLRRFVERGNGVGPADDTPPEEWDPPQLTNEEVDESLKAHVKAMKRPA